MWSAFLFIFLVCTAVLLQDANSFLEVPCPLGCRDVTCTAGIGCSNCNPGYCLKLGDSRTGSYCLSSCPKGFYCYHGTFNFCTACGDHCDQCLDRQTCTRCKSGYSLSSSNRCY